MSTTTHTLTTPYAVSPTPLTYGGIDGSRPDWKTTNMHDRGRCHRPSTVKSELLDTGLGSFLSAPEPANPYGRRHFSAGHLRHAEPIAEPAAVGGHYSYYTRRHMDGDNPTSYRRTLKHIPEPQRLDKPQGVRYIPEPHGPPPHINGLKTTPEEVRYARSASAPEPGLPSLGRLGPGLTCLRETDKELIFERVMNRKVRVDQGSYRGLGRAGDTTGSLGAPVRPEVLDPSLYKTLTDSPTFIRFCNSLPPKPAVSPHQRRADAARRMYEAERNQERDLVSKLDIPGVDDD